MGVSRKVALFFNLILLSSIASADIWAEREALAKIRTELESLETLVINAKRLSNPEDRMTFQYDELLKDISKIKDGVNQHLNVPMEPVLPREINPLENNYTEHNK